MFRKTMLAVSMGLVFSMSGCGGGGDSDPVNSNNLKTGIFLDAPVKGLTYSASPSGETGTTNEAGEFNYKEGDKVSFSMGSIALGKGTPDAAAKVKITQLANAVLIGQLLQTLDLDEREEAIDVSGIVIPQVVLTAIIEKIEQGSQEDVLASSELADIKADNTGKIFAEDNVVTKAEVIEHIEGQLSEQGLVFTAAELDRKTYIASSVISAFDGMIMKFKEGDSKVRWIDGDSTPLSHQSKYPFDISNGKLIVHFNDSTNDCTITKLAEDDASIDASIICESSHSSLVNLLKPRSFSASDLEGKTITVQDGGDEPATTFVFSQDGTFIETNEGSKIYKNSSKYNNSVWLNFGGDNNPNNGGQFYLAEGTINQGTIIGLFYNTDNSLDDVIVLTASGNEWPVLHGGRGSDVSGDNITSGKVDFTNGQTPSKAYVRLVPEDFQHDNGGKYNYGDGLRCKVQSDGTWGMSDCLITENGKKAEEFQSGNNFQFLIFIDTNGDTHYNREESSICHNGNASWEDWKPTFTCTN